MKFLTVGPSPLPFSSFLAQIFASGPCFQIPLVSPVPLKIILLAATETKVTKSIYHDCNEYMDVILLYPTFSWKPHKHMVSNIQFYLQNVFCILGIWISIVFLFLECKVGQHGKSVHDHCGPVPEWMRRCTRNKQFGLAHRPQLCLRYPVSCPDVPVPFPHVSMQISPIWLLDFH